MTSQQSIDTNYGDSYQGTNSVIHRAAPLLLFASGIILGVGYNMHMAGFFAWMTLVIAGATLFAAGTLWGDGRRFAWLAVSVALVGALLCISALPDQLRAQEAAAAVANVAVILCQLVAMFLILHMRLVIHPQEE